MPDRKHHISIILSVLVVLLIAAPAFGRETAGTGQPKLGLELSRPGTGQKVSGRLSGGAAISSSVDLSGNAPPIGNQQSQASCVGWAAGYYGKTWYEKVEHPDWDLSQSKYSFSPAFIYNQINGGHDDGSSLFDALELLENTGCTDLEQFPYDGNYTKQPDSTAVEAAKQYHNSADWGYFFVEGGWGQYSRPDVVTEVKQWLAGGDPVMMGIPIYEDFPNWRGSPSKSYYDYNGVSSLAGGHAVFIAGYNDNINPMGLDANHRGGFLVLNSWGQNWNGNGRVYLSYDFVQRYVPEAWGMGDRSSAPGISSLDPSGGSLGQTVTIKGANLGAARRGARVAFPGGSGQVVSWANSQIKVRVPSTTSGDVYVYDWDSDRTGGKAFTAGAPSFSGADWLMAEGATWPGFEEYILLQNPNTTTSTVSVDFLTSSGPKLGPSVTVPALSRTTVHVNDYCPNADVAAAITVESGPDICAERAMYLSSPDGKWGAHDSIGTQTAAADWYLAEGATLPGYDEWIMVMNPYNKAVAVKVTWLTPDGPLPGPDLSVPANSRQTVHVNDHIPNSNVSARLECVTADAGIVVERSMYMNTWDGKIDCHNSMGVSETWGAWAMAEGATFPGFEEWVLVMNPGASPVTADLLFMTPDGQRTGPTETIQAGQRVSIKVNDWVPDSEVSTVVLTRSEDQRVVAERSMYVSSNGRRGAHNAPGSIYAATGWLLPEGCTAPGFDEWVLVMNPGDTEANVQLEFMTAEGSITGPGAVLPALTRRTFHVNDYCSGDVSTKVTSDRRVIAERAMYIATGDGKAGATSSLGVPSTWVIGSSGSSAGTGADLLYRP